MAAIGRGAPGGNSASSAAASSPPFTCTPLDTKTERHADRRGAGDVGVDAVADGEQVRRLGASRTQRLERGERQLVDRQVGLARIGHRAAEPLVGARERAGAIDETPAALHGNVRVGADHRKAARSARGERLGVVVGRLALVVEEAGAHDRLGALRTDALHVDAGKDAEIALRPQVHDRAAGVAPRSACAPRRRS